jgi:hypothetical protein
MTINEEKSTINVQNKTSFKDMDTYLRVSISGKWLSELILETLLYIKKKADLANHTRILIDCFDLAPPRGDFERIFAGLDVAFILKYPFRIAVLYPLDLTTYQTENIAINRGSFFRTFEQENEALEWLLTSMATEDGDP